MVDTNHFFYHDIPVVVELGRAFHKESQFADLPFNESSTENYLRRVAADPNIFSRVATLDNQIVGFLTGFLQSPPFSYLSCAHEELLYVTPEARGHGAGTILLQEFVKWARFRGAYKVFFGVNSGIATEKTVAKVQEQGFIPCGIILRKDMLCVDQAEVANANRH